MKREFYKKLSIGRVIMEIIHEFDLSREHQLRPFPPDFFTRKIFIGCGFAGMIFPENTDFSETILVDPDLTNATFQMHVNFTNTHILFIEDKREPRTRGMHLPVSALHSFVKALGFALPDNGFYLTQSDRARSYVNDMRVMCMFGFLVKQHAVHEKPRHCRNQQVSFLTLP